MVLYQGPLLNGKHERFCQMVAVEGLSPAEAYNAIKAIKLIGRKANGIGAPNAKKLCDNELVAKRIATLQERNARRAELSYDGIIAEVQEEGKLARMAGQHSAALKAWEMLGSELHKGM